MDKLANKLKYLITIYKKNLYHTQKSYKQVYYKSIKLKNYALGNNIRLNNKYIKTKQNQNLEVIFFGLFQTLYPIGK